MANKKNNKKGYTGPAKAQPKSVPMTKKQKIFTLVASILIVAIVAAAVVLIVRSMREGPVDLMKDDLSKYITLSRDDYSSITVELPLEEYDEMDLVRKINDVLVQNKSKDPLYDGGAYKSKAITLGDVVSLMYRGYYIDENGKEKEISTNFAQDTWIMLEVGTGKIIDESGDAGYFITGFTDDMLGKIPMDYEPFKKYSEGKVQEGDVIYLSYTAFYPDEAGTYKQVTAERIDLNEDIDAIYGKGFKAYILGTAEGTEAQSIGEKISSKTFPYSSGSAGYSDMKIEYVTRGCENAPLTISVTFPASYSEASLRGVEAFFDVYIASAIVYETPELDEKFITETLKLTAEDLASYEGANLVEKYKKHLEKSLKNEIDETNEKLIVEKVWDLLFDLVKVEELPEYTVDEYYQTYYNEVSYYYSLYSSYYTSFDLAATDYLSLAQGTDWRSVLKKKAEDTTLEEIIFYYIIREENFIPSKSEFNEIRNSIIDAHYEYYLDLNADELSKLTGEAYDKRAAEIKTEMLEYYGDAYFDENVYYNYGMDKIVEHLVTVK